MEGKLTPTVTLLYREILNLSKKKGYCMALNGFLANAINRSESTVNKGVSELRNRGLIKVEHTYSATTMKIIERKIFPTKKSPLNGLRAKEDLSPVAVLMLEKIMTICNKKEPCVLTSKQLGKKIKRSERTVRRILSELEKKKYIEVFTEGNRRLVYIIK